MSKGERLKKVERALEPQGKIIVYMDWGGDKIEASDGTILTREQFEALKKEHPGEWIHVGLDEEGEDEQA